MPKLENITYSREGCIAAFRSYFDFLTKMYLDKSYIIEPPPGGWPSISKENMQALGKTDEVSALLRHLPYIRDTEDDSLEAQAVPYGKFADWQGNASLLGSGQSTTKEVRMGTEGAEYQDIPGHVLGLIDGGRDDQTFLLDTQLGIVYWLECPNGPKHHPTREQVKDDCYDYALEEECECRSAPAWSVDDFFEMLKDQYRSLSFVPIDSRTVYDVNTKFQPRSQGFLLAASEVFQQHGWPDMDRYQKTSCLNAIRTTLEERYPHIVNRLDDDDGDSSADDDGE